MLFTCDFLGAHYTKHDLFADYTKELEEAAKNREFQQHSADLAWERSKETMQSAYNFQREMRQTAYQDTMSDMKAAGLNPILAAQLGPTSTSSVQTAQSFAASGSQADISDRNISSEVLQQVLGLIGTAAMAYAVGSKVKK